jgi:hypothetical protein
MKYATDLANVPATCEMMYTQIQQDTALSTGLNKALNNFSLNFM